MNCTNTVLALIVLFALPTHARERAPVREFRSTHLCPSTGDKTGPCPGYVVDHIVPLCWGGLDVPSNMAWQELQESYKKDVFERAACKLKTQKESPITCKSLCPIPTAP